MSEAGNARSEAEEDAFHAWVNARNCLLYEKDPDSELLNVGTQLKPLRIPRSEAWQQSYSMRVLCECDGDHSRLLAARQACAEHKDRDQEAWSRAVDLCDQALRMIEGAGAVSDDKARKVLIAVCEYENMRTAFGPFSDAEADTRTLTEALREAGATMADVPSAEALVSWAFPWL